MKKALTALFAAAALAAGVAVALGGGLVGEFVASTIGGSAGEGARSATYAVAPQPGYVTYSSGAALPRPSCYWTRMPVYDSNSHLIGWRGAPLAVCPE